MLRIVALVGGASAVILPGSTPKDYANGDAVRARFRPRAADSSPALRARPLPTRHPSPLPRSPFL
jgi:hypothetical protein